MKTGPIDPWRSNGELKRALDDKPSLLFIVARSGSNDDLLRCLSSLETTDERRVQLVLSALASREVSDAELAQIATALTWMEQTSVLATCGSVPRERLEQAGFVEESFGAWGARYALPLDLPRTPPSWGPGRIGEERRLFDQRFSLGGTVNAHLGYVAERSSGSLGPAAAPIPPALSAFIEEHRFGPLIEAVQRGERAIEPHRREEIRELLSTLDDGARFQLREILLPRKPLHPLRAEHAKDEALKGKATPDKLVRILAGEMFDPDRAVDPKRIDHVLKLVAKHLPPGTELEWADLLSRSSAAQELVERFGGGVLPLLATFDSETLAELGSQARLYQLVHAAAVRPEIADEAKAYLDRFGREKLIEALEILDGGGRAELPQRTDGWTWVKVDASETTIGGWSALSRLSLADSIALFQFLSQNQAAVRSALYLMHPSLASPNFLPGKAEDDRGRALLRIVQERGLGALEEIVAHARERIHSIADDTTPLWTGGVWPPALSTAPAPEADLGELSRSIRRMMEDLDRIPAAKEKLERELAGRRFVAFTYYDPLYLEGVENPEHRYSKKTFEAWEEAEAEMRRAADEGRGRPLESGWLTDLFSGLHSIAARGIVDTQQSGNMSRDQVGHIRCTEKEGVQLPDLVDVDEALAARLTSNPWLGKDTRISEQDGQLKARIFFADGDRVPELLAKVDRFVREHEGKMAIEDLVTEVHNALVGIHAPFDGNGRTSKLVIDFLLRRAGIEPLIWRQRHPLKDPTTAETIRIGVQFTHDIVLRHWLHAGGDRSP